MSATQLYDTWFRQLRKLLPEERLTRVRNLAWLIVGLALSRSAHLSHIAAKLPFRVTLLATVQRLSRFLQNPAFRVRDWYRPVAQDLLAAAARSGPVRLIIDGSKVGGGHQLLIVALAYRRRALPIAWTWVRGVRGHSGATKQLALLRYVQGLLPAQARVELVGDGEFGAVAVLRQLTRWRWRYVLRQKSNTWVCVSRRRRWQHLGDLVSGPGQLTWHPRALLTQQLCRTRLLTYWAPGEAEPWLLATNLPTAQQALCGYRRRMWIEEMFGDWKGHGFDLALTRLQHFPRLSRLTLAIALLYLALVTQGARAIKNGQRRLVDRKGRRDLSLFRLGLYLTDRCLACSSRLALHLIPYF